MSVEYTSITAAQEVAARYIRENVSPPTREAFTEWIKPQIEQLGKGQITQDEFSKRVHDTVEQDRPTKISKKYTTEHWFDPIRVFDFPDIFSTDELIKIVNNHLANFFRALS